MIVLADGYGPVETVLTVERRHQLARLRDWIVESSGDQVLIYREETIVQPGDLPAFLDVVRHVISIYRTAHTSVPPLEVAP